MGVYVYGGNVAIQQLYDLDSPPNYIARAVNSAIHNNDDVCLSLRYPQTNVATEIVTAYSNTYANRVDRYFRYGERLHPDGLPSNINTANVNSVGSALENLQVPHEAIQGIIEEEVGERIEIVAYEYGLPIVSALARDALESSPLHVVSSYWHDPVWTVVATGKSYGRVDQYLIGTDLTIVGQPLKWIQASPTNPVDLPARWQNDGTPVNFEFDLTLTNNVTSTKLYHMAFYDLLSDESRHSWWYDETTNVYPILNNTQISASGKGSYPFAMLIDDGLKITSPHIEEGYLKANDAMLGKIDLSTEKLLKGLDNPDDPSALDDVKDAWLMYAANLSSDKEYVNQYFYEFFRQQYHLDYERNDTLHSIWADDHVATPTANLGNSLGPAAHFKGQKVGFSLYYRWIRVTVKTGHIDSLPADLGDPTAANAELETKHPFVSEIDAENTGALGRTKDKIKVGHTTRNIRVGVNHGTVSPTWDGVPHQFTDHYLVLRKQMTETTYSEIVVMGVEHFTSITGFGDAGTSVDRVFIVNFLDTVVEGQIFVPLDYTVMQRFSPFIQSAIMYEGLSVGVHLFTELKLPWYTDAGMWKIIGIFLTLLSLGSIDWGAITSEIAKQLIKRYLIGLALSHALTLLVDLIGGEAAIILALILQGIAIANGSKGEFVFDGLIKAENLLLVATSLITATNRVTEARNKDTEQLIEDYAVEKEERAEELKNLEAQLDLDGEAVELYSLISYGTYTDFEETPSEFFNRSVHLTNPGVLSLDAVDSYVCNALTLPTVDQSPFNNTNVGVI